MDSLMALMTYDNDYVAAMAMCDNEDFENWQRA